MENGAWSSRRNHLATRMEVDVDRIHVKKVRFICLNYPKMLSAALKPMLISRNQVRAHGIIEGSTGSAIRTSGTMMIKPLLFYGFRSNYLSVFNITFYLFDVGDDYLKSCVAEVIKSSWSWVSLR